MLATVRLVNSVFYAHHGVMQEEHRIGGRFEVDVAMDLDVDAAAKEDDLTQTVDYERVYSFIKEVMLANKFYLIDKIAYTIAHEVLDHYSKGIGVDVTVRKPNPPVGGPCDRADVTYRASRDST